MNQIKKKCQRPPQHGVDAIQHLKQPCARANAIPLVDILLFVHLFMGFVKQNVCGLIVK